MIHAPHIAVFAAWLIGWVLLFRVPRIPRTPRRGDGDDDHADSTIVIPARNEEDRLPDLLSDLARSRPAGARVFVVDDDSTDGTAETARRFDFVTVLDAPPEWASWMGKARACEAGARRASNGTLVFLDADVRVGDGTIGRLAADVQTRDGLVSVWPRHTVQRPYEHLSALFNLVALMGIGCGSLLPSRRVRGAFGPVIATSSEDYRRVGGHAAVRRDIVEDFAMAHRYRDASLAVRVYGGHEDIAFRMYPHGFASLVEGWTKNFGTAALAVSWLRLGLIGFWLVCSIGLFTWAGGVPARPAWILYGLYVLQMRFQLGQVGTFGWLDAVLYPVHVLFFGVLFLVSLFRTFILRRVSWRGRTIRLGGPEPTGEDETHG